jgi:ATP-dependent RNA helicase DHX29
MNSERIDFDLITKLIAFICEMRPANDSVTNPGCILVFLPGIYEIRKLENQLNQDILDSNHPYYRINIMKLHGNLDNTEQAKVFNAPKKGYRKVILATNVAETGVTIPDVVYVINTMKAREISFDKSKGMTRLLDVTISQANAKQRCGRAGRLTSGICYHLITLEGFEKLKNHRLPEMQRLPLQDICLKLRTVIKDQPMHELLQELIDPPPIKHITMALDTLKYLDAFDDKEHLTAIGTFFSKLPIDVKLGNLVLYGLAFACIDPIITITSILGFGKSIFSNQGQFEGSNITKTFINNQSDYITWLNVYNSWANMHIQKKSADEIEIFCRLNQVSQTVLEMIHESRIYLYESLFKTILIDCKMIPKTRFPVPISLDSDINANQRNENAILCAIGFGLYPNIVLQTKSSLLYLGSQNMITSIHPSSTVDPMPNFFYVFYSSQIKKGMNGVNKLSVYDFSKIHSLIYPLVAKEMDYKPEENILLLDHLPFKCCIRTAVAFHNFRNFIQTLKYDVVSSNWSVLNSKTSVLINII